jgi:hypothetical protein
LGRAAIQRGNHKVNRKGGSDDGTTSRMTEAAAKWELTESYKRTFD